MQPLQFRPAIRADLPSIIELLADDPLGRQRERPGTPLDHRYIDAFAAINADPNQLLAVAMLGEQLAGCLQLSFIPGLSRSGLWRGQIESVRVAADQRGLGIGRQMLEWAIGECRARDCDLVQLTTDTSRPAAARFYQSLGFEASHLGMKLPLI